MGKIRFFLFMLFTQAVTTAALYALENTNLLNLPETPPAIEYIRRSPLDKPVLQKQRFFSDPELNTLPVIDHTTFSSFYKKTYPCFISLQTGSLGFSENSIIVSSTESWNILYLQSRFEGENKYLYKENQNLDVNYGAKYDGGTALNIKAKTNNITVWSQLKRWNSSGADLVLYPASNLNLKANVQYETLDIPSYGFDRSFSGIFSATSQLFSEDERLSLVYRNFGSNSFSRNGNFSDISASYIAVPFSFFSFGAGTVLHKDEFYPQAEVTFFPLHKIRGNFRYESGIEPKQWSKLYFNSFFEEPNAGINFPDRKTFSQNISYYYNEENYAELSFSQTKWKDYLYREAASVFPYVKLSSLSEKDTNCAVFHAAYGNDSFSSELFFWYNSESDVAFVPKYSFEERVFYSVNRWKLGVFYQNSQPVKYSMLSEDRIPGKDIWSAMLQRQWTSSVSNRLYIDNMFSRSSAAQPGFEQSASVVRGELIINF